MVATLRIYNSACCLERFGFLGVIDRSDTFRDVWEPVPYGNVCLSLKLQFNAECVIRNAELMVAALLICNNACCTEKYVCCTNFDILTMFNYKV